MDNQLWTDAPQFEAEVKPVAIPHETKGPPEAKRKSEPASYSIFSSYFGSCGEDFRPAAKTGLSLSAGI